MVVSMYFLDTKIQSKLVKEHSRNKFIQITAKIFMLCT